MRPQALRLSLHSSAAITLEIGSRFFVDGSQDSEKIHFVAILAGDEGFEPPITGPEPVALPLGQSPMEQVDYSRFAGGSQGAHTSIEEAHDISNIQTRNQILVGMIQ